ncbi:protein mono-ADP-ribosyltransferase PARP12 isoform X1 [Anguilla anguilla]|uniref:protein mono-ADP-ribosyltransferase PARP12 isoform X1 n=1 Tax=Anguilla anguilla TaxID=7936 RepID=UPI0015A9B57A|nr:protein mono-ADP-ribosyltransferase PARP12 isoform X1 [Anguilla anguilla]
MKPKVFKHLLINLQLAMASNCNSSGSPQDGESDSQLPSAGGHDDSQEECSFSESESDFASSDSDSGPESQQGARQSRPAPSQACKFYNQGKCKNGKKCQYLHVCQYFLKGKCRYGSGCRLKHISNSGSESSEDEGQSRQRRNGRRRSSSGENAANDGRPYRWQLNSGSGWKNIENDHIIEAQYSRPSARGIRLYNTRFGVIAIDFKKMKVLKKTGLRVRRWSSSQAGLNTEWVWYCSRKNDWVQYGEKDSKGKVASVTSSKIEKEFQKSPKGSLRFTIDATNYRINFRDMSQENFRNGRKRDVARRPKLMIPQDRGGSVTAALQGLGVSSPTWEFEGNSGKWYIFKHRKPLLVSVQSGTDTESSVSSAEIEAQFQRNPQGSMNFTVSGQQYTLDFSDMTQTNLNTHTVRRVRRS